MIFYLKTQKKKINCFDDGVRLNKLYQIQEQLNDRDREFFQSIFINAW